MTVKYHKKNTNFQIEHFLMKGAHTPDNAYFQLLELKEEREMALDAYKVGKIRRDAKELQANELELRGTPAEKLEAKALLQEMHNWDKYEGEMYKSLVDELAFIESKLEELKPQCQYVGKMDIISAHEASQRDAWRMELMKRAENYLLTTGSIPADHLHTMRCHPDFKEHILPKIKDVQKVLKTGDVDKVNVLLE